MKISGIGIFDFCIRGEIYRVDNFVYSNDLKDEIGDKIIVIDEALPDIVLLFNQVKGIICIRGGLTCHLSMLSLEAGVPCVVAAKEAVNLKNGMNVVIESHSREGLITCEGTTI